MTSTIDSDVLLYAQIDSRLVRDLLSRYELETHLVNDLKSIPGSFWGEQEAGLIANRLYLRNDTPLHSILHEACHYICMDSQRRAELDTDAGSDNDEENAVCYLQILLADEITGLGRERILSDMDAWGYSFRLGSAAAWFQNDARETRDWLEGHGIINRFNQPQKRKRN